MVVYYPWTTIIWVVGVRFIFLILTFGWDGLTVTGLRHTCNHDILLHTGKIPPTVASEQNYSVPSSSSYSSSSSAFVIPLRSLATNVAEQITGFNMLTANYQPLRIHSIFVDVTATATGMTVAKKNFLMNTLVPRVTEQWKTLLKVNPVNGKLYAFRQCKAIYTDSGRCAEYLSETQCGYSTGTVEDDVKIVIADDYLGNQTYYSSTGTPTELPQGNGISGADFIMYVTAKHVPSICPNDGDSGTLAYALTCQRDQYDRPTFGRVNFCPYAISDAVADWNISLAVGMHEYAHALGFSASSWSLFRNWDTERSPKTSRDPLWTDTVDSAHLTSTYVCGGKLYDQVPYADASTTVKYFGERGMSKCTIEQAGSNPSDCVHKFVGYRVLTAARQHFACSTLNGVELENHLTTSCSLQGSHWEQRIFNPELMTSYIQPKPLLSAVTLALFEESGWYKANYANASGWRKGLDWGFKQGCDFAVNACIDKTNGIGTGSPPHFYSTNPSRICTLDREAIGTVLISNGGSSLPSQYRYFTDTTKGGDSNMDYCPVIEAYSNTHCTDITSPSAQDITVGKYFGESYGPDRACFETTLRQTGNLSPPTGAGCLKYACQNTTDENGLSLLITAIGTTVTASVTCTVNDKGSKKSMSTGFTGQITCPDVRPLCQPPEIMIPSFDASQYWNANTEDEASAVPVVVQATLLIAGLTFNSVQSPGITVPFTTAVTDGLALLLNLSATEVNIQRIYVASSRRLWMRIIPTTVSRSLAPGDLAIDFTVRTTYGTGSTTVNRTLIQAFGGGSIAAPYASALTTLLNNVAIVTGVPVNTLTVFVNPSSISTIPVTTITVNEPTVGISEGAIGGIIAAALVILTIGSLLYVWLTKRQSAKVTVLLSSSAVVASRGGDKA